jgi:Meckel syndrome type 1 protein
MASKTTQAKQRSKKAAAAAANKPAPKAKAAKANGNGGPSKREAAAQRDLELAPKVKEMRDNGASWADVKDKLGVDQPKGQVLLKMASVRPKDRIKAANDEELAEKIVAARNDQGLSWADIAVRAGITMGKVKSLFEAGGGGSAAESRVQKAEKAAPKAKAKAEPKAKATPAKKAAPAKGKPAATKTRKKAAKADPSDQG